MKKKLFTKKQLLTYTIIAAILILMTYIGVKYQKQAEELLKSPWGWLVLAIWSFTESSFFIIPPDPGIALMAVNNNWFLVAVFATVWSVFGALFGHYLGKRFGNEIAIKLFGKDKVIKVEKLFQDWSGISLLIAAVTPIPFKVFTILSGVMEVNRKDLILYSTIGRGLRFILVAFIVSQLSSNEFINQNKELIFIILGITIFLGGVLWVMLVKKKNKAK